MIGAPETKMNSYALTQGIAPKIIDGIEVYSSKSSIDTETAASIAELFKELYVTYPDEVLQEPSLLQQQVKDGKWIAFIARDENKKVIGHAALIAGSDGAFDLGRLVVSKEAQGQSLGKKLVDARLAYASSAHDIQVLHSETVTSHTKTQRFCEQEGFVPTGLHLAKFTQFFEGDQQRESILMVTKVMDEQVKSNRAVFLPERYANLAGDLYNALGCSRKIMRTNCHDSLLPDKPTLHVDNNDLKGFGLTVIKANAAVDTEALTQVASQASKDAEFVEFKLDCSHPASIGQALALRSMGFIFGGIAPGKSSDYLIMQQMKSCPKSSLNLVKLHSPHSEKLRSEIRTLEGLD